MDRRYARIAVQVLALVGISVSTFMLIEYLVPDARSLCGPGGGCTGVHHSSLGQAMIASTFPFMPTVGIVSFLGLFVLSLAPGVLPRHLTRYVALIGGLAGAFLIVQQVAVIHSLCKFCMVADTAAILAAIFAWLGAKDASTWRTPGWLFGVYGLVLVLAVGGSVAVHRDAFTRAPITAQVVALPAAIVREQRPGVATIVEFADFECPYCRRQHTELTQVLPGYGARVHFVQKQIPLAMHPHAQDAARAACCAEEQGRGEAVENALFETEDLSPAGCEAVAAHAGVDLTAYRACLHAPRIDTRLQTDRDSATQSEVRGLPTMFIGRERFDGVVPAAVLRQSIDRALQQASGGPAT